MRDNNTNMWIRLWYGIIQICGWNYDREWYKYMYVHKIMTGNLQICGCNFDSEKYKYVHMIMIEEQLKYVNENMIVKICANRKNFNMWIRLWDGIFKYVDKAMMGIITNMWMRLCKGIMQICG